MGWSESGGCFSLLFDYGKKTGLHECREDYSLTVRDFIKDLWVMEGWEAVQESAEGDVDISTEDLEKNDVLVMSFDLTEPLIKTARGRLKHAAMYLGDGILLHHKAHDVSRLEYVKPYIPHIRYVLRKV